jgi:hypothetical protein
MMSIHYLLAAGATSRLDGVVAIASLVTAATTIVLCLVTGYYALLTRSLADSQVTAVRLANESLVLQRSNFEATAALERDRWRDERLRFLDSIAPKVEFAVSATPAVQWRVSDSPFGTWGTRPQAPSNHDVQVRVRNVGDTTLAVRWDGHESIEEAELYGGKRHLIPGKTAALSIRISHQSVAARAKSDLSHFRFEFVVAPSIGGVEDRYMALLVVSPASPDPIERPGGIPSSDVRGLVAHPYLAAHVSDEPRRMVIES